MATLLLTVEGCYPTDQGLVALPCLPLEALLSRPEFLRLQQGSRIEVRRPDGTCRESRIATYGAPSRWALTVACTFVAVSGPRSSRFGSPWRGNLLQRMCQ
jgi:hypothetical protein